MSKKIIILGAGNIGRSFLGQIFSMGGYEVVFVDIDSGLISALNRERGYRVIVKRSDLPDESIRVDNVRGVHISDLETVRNEIAGASLAATAVGKANLAAVFPPLAAGLELRREQGGQPLDIIIAENVRGVEGIFRTGISAFLPEDYPFTRLVGLVQTSIGKMVPIMTATERRQDPLWVFAEEYNELIVDECGFRNPLPCIDGILPCRPIEAYVDRKLFIHNLGHAAAAYLGFAARRDLTYLYEVLAIPEILHSVRQCMEEAAAALKKEYPAVFTRQSLGIHIQDLLNRFRNRALRDTIYRAGRDVPRKLDKNDRLIGAMLLAKKHGLPCGTIARAVFAATFFCAHDEQGKLFNTDRDFLQGIVEKALPHILFDTSHLSGSAPVEAQVLEDVTMAAKSPLTQDADHPRPFAVLKHRRRPSRKAFV